jgi:hypothetical protein
MPNGSSAFDRYRALGVDVYQAQLSWADTAPKRPSRPADPTDPAYRWPRTLDTAVKQAGSRGIRVAVMPKEAPPWANGGRSTAWAPREPQDYALFVRAASRRYPSVKRWMVWGEPSQAGNFEPMPKGSPAGPRRYARLLDAAYGQLKRQSAQNVVVGAMTYTWGAVRPRDWVRWMRLPNGRPPRLDEWGHNPFSYRYPKLSNPVLSGGRRDFSDLDNFIREIHSAYKPLNRRPRLWLSEYTIPSDRPDRVFNFYVSREGQAKWVTRGYEVSRNLKWVTGLGWWRLQDDDPSIPNGITGGLITYAGRPKASFWAYTARPELDSARCASPARRGATLIGLASRYVLQ